LIYRRILSAFARSIAEHATAKLRV